MLSIRVSNPPAVIAQEVDVVRVAVDLLLELAVARVAEPDTLGRQASK